MRIISTLRAGRRRSAAFNQRHMLGWRSIPHLTIFLVAAAAVVLGSAIANAQLIPQDEAQHLMRRDVDQGFALDLFSNVLAPVDTLRTISQKLSNRFWKVSRTSCTDHSFNVSIADRIFSNVTCDCTLEDNSVCHVTSIQMKGLNLTGPFPSEFGDLTYLREIDLSHNYVSGSIPTSLTKIPLVNLSVGSNIISGSIPEELSQIPTLEYLIFQDNRLGGSLPPSLGNLNRLKRLELSANNFTGTIPASYGKLKNLTSFKIDGNSLSGKIPDLIGNWTKISRLDMQGTGMEGPIPSSLSYLKNITELRISDLKGSSMEFPNLKGLNNLRTLELRNCLITGVIPDYIGDFTNLKSLDLSFNQLTGKIPDALQTLQNLNYLFLLNNSLSGAVPYWITNRKQRFDVSYNNFTGASPTSCQQANVNLVSSYSSTNDNINYWCLQKDLPCPGKPQYYSMFINCGGSKISYDRNDYEEDLSNTGPSNFFAAGNKWAYSSTGYWMGNDRSNYVVSTTPDLNMTGPKVYQTARTSPLSLKYYGLCLRQGSYKVQLHFAEIMFSDDHTYNSVGRRIFDVSIQGNRVLRDFNIAKEAGGVGKNLTLSFDDIHVNGSTLEVSLYWAGKGTTIVPGSGVYGPLISAITVTPNFKVGKKLSIGSIVGIVLGSVAVVSLALFVLRMKGYLGGKEDEYKEFRGLDSYFSLKQIKAATEDFDPRNKIGEGGFGPVYKGVLPDGKVIAVKQLSSKSKQGNREFVNEVGMISAIQHPNLVKLYGWCIEAKELLLVYEYMDNNSLARTLFGRQEQRLDLDWPTRMKICLGIARGLAYLHEESRLKIIHRDIKATNVLLDKDLNAKISDFGLAKLDEEENTHMSTRIAGTMGYMAPEYAMRGYLTDKADVYSFGVVILEIVSGKSNTSFRPKEEFVYLLDWAYVLHEQGNILELVDPSLGENYAVEDASRMLNLALLCTSHSPTLRPRMSSVVGMIEGRTPIQAPIVKNAAASEEGRRFKALSIDSNSMCSQFSTATNSHITQGSMSTTNGPWTTSQQAE